MTFWQEVDFLIGNASVLLTVEWFKTPVSSQTQKLVAATKFSDYLGLKHYKKAEKLKHFIHLRLANTLVGNSNDPPWENSESLYCVISYTVVS